MNQRQEQVAGAGAEKNIKPAPARATCSWLSARQEFPNFCRLTYPPD